MFPILATIPVEIPAVAVQVAAASALEKKDRTVGFCFPMENSPDPRAQHTTALDPLVALENYFRVVEHAEVKLSGKISLVQPVEHGTLTAFDNGTDYEYTPTPGYYGSDRATVLIELEGMKVRLVYFFKIREVINDADREELCPKYYWKISLNSGAPGNVPNLM
jgi:hypothetical protein